MSSRGTSSLVTDTSDNGNPNATPRDDTTLIIAVAAAIGALFLLVLVLFILFVLYYYKKGDPDDEETYHSRASSRSESRTGSRPGSRIGSRRGSIIRSVSLRNNLQPAGMFLPNSHDSGWMKSRSTKMTTGMVNGSLDNLPRGDANKGFTDNYEDIDRDFWHDSKGGEGKVTHNPAFGKDDDLKPLDANLHRFDMEVKPEEDVDSGMADFSAVEDSSKEVDHEEDKETDNQIRILDMSTWSSPPSTLVPSDEPSPFTISSQVSQQDRHDEDVPVNFTRANPLHHSTSDLYQSSTKNRNQSVVDFYENANPTILGYSMQFPADAYGTGRRLLWQKKSFDDK